MTNTIETKFTASLGSGTEQTFNSMQKGFQKIATELQKTAKELLNLQKTEAAEAVGHVSMAVNKFAASLGGLNKEAKETSNSLKTLEQAEKSFEKTSNLAKEAWSAFKKDIEAGRTTIGAAKARAMEYDKAINNLIIDIKLLGGSEKDLNKNINFADVALRQQSGDLKLVGGQFKNLSADSYAYLVTNKNLVKSLKELHNNTSLYNTVLREASKLSYGDSQVKAIRELGQQVGYADSKFRLFIPILKSMDSDLTKLGIAQKNLTGENAKWISSVDRAAVVNQVLSNAQTGLLKHISMTSNGLKILSLEGMKPFGDLTLKTAQTLGMLDPNFNKFIQNMNVLKVLTGSSTEEMMKQRVAIMKQTSSFEEANAKAKEFISNEKQKIQVQEATDKVLNKLSIQYRNLLSSSNSYGTESRKLLDILKQNPKEIDSVKASLSNLNSEYRTQQGTVTAAKKAQEVLVIQYRELLTASGKVSDEARKRLALLDTEPQKLAVVKAELSKMNAEYTKQENEIRKNREANASLVLKYEDLITSTGKYGIQARNLLGILQKNPDELKKIQSEMSKLNSSYETNKNQMEKQAEQYTILSIKYRDLLQSSSVYAESAKRVLATLKLEGASIGEVSALLRQLDGDQKKASKSGSAFGDVINNIAKSFRTYASYMISSNVLQGFVGGLQHATKVVMEHDQALYDLKSILSATNAEVGLLDDLLLSLTKSSKYKISEISDSMKDFGQAGFDAAETIHGMPAIMDLATGTMESLRQATELTSTAVTVFGLGMEDARMVADVFANSVTKSRSTVAKLNTSFNYIGPVAEQAGLSLRDTAAATMLMYNAGLRASTVGTGLTNMLNGLMKPSEAFKIAVEQAGYSIDDFNPRLASWEEILQRLPNVVKNSEDAIKMFDVRAGRAIMAFTTLGIDQFRKLKGSLDEQGVAAKMAATQMEGLSNKWKNVQNNFDVLIVNMSKSGFATILKTLIGLSQGLVLALSEASETMAGQFVLSLVTTGAALAGMAGGVKVIWTLLATKFIPELKKANAALWSLAKNPFGAALTAIVIALTAASSVMNEYRRDGEELLKTETERATTIENVKTKLEAYNKAVQEHGKYSDKAKEAGKDLKYSIDAMGSSLKDSSELVKEFGSAIDESGTVLKDLDFYTTKLSESLDKRLVVSLTNAAKGASQANKSWWEWLGNLFGNNWDDLDDSVNVFLQSYRRLKEEAQSGNSDKASWLEQMGPQIEVFTALLLKGKDAGALTSEEIDKMAVAFVKANKLSTEYGGALIISLNKASRAAIESKQDIEDSTSSISKMMKVVNDGYAKLLKDTSTTYETKVQYINDSVSKVRAAAESELNEKRKQHIKEVENFKGTREQLEKLQSDHEKEIQALVKEGKNSEEKLLRDKQTLYVVHYETQLKNIDKYYEQERQLAEEASKSLQEAERSKYEKGMANIEKTIQDESKKYSRMNDLLVQHTKVSLEQSDIYYTQLAEISKKDYEVRIEAAKILPDEEAKVKEKVLALNIEQISKQKEIMVTRREDYKQRLSEMVSLEKDLTSKINDEIKSREEFHKGVEETLRDLSYKTLNEKQIYEKEYTRAVELENQAREAILVRNYDLAKEKAKESIEAFKSASSSLDTTNVAAYTTELGKIGDKIKTVSSVYDEASGSMESNLESQRRKVEETVTILNDAISKMSVEISTVVSELQKISVTPITVNVNALQDVEKLNRYLDEINKKPATINFMAGEGPGSTLSGVTEKITKINGELSKMFSDDGNVTNNTKELVYNFKGSVDGEAEPLSNTVSKVNTKINEINTVLSQMTKSNVINFTMSETSTNVIAQLNELKSKLETIAKTWELKLVAEVTGKEELKDVWDVWNKLSTSRDMITKTINYVVTGDKKSYDDASKKTWLDKVIDWMPDRRHEEGKSSVAGVRAKTGKKIPGYGGGDTVPALLERGEWVINKEAVAHYEDKYGSDYWKALNEKRAKFRKGGRVGEDDEKELMKNMTPRELKEYEDKKKEEEEAAKLEQYKAKRDNKDAGTFDVGKWRDFFDKIEGSKFSNVMEEFKQTGDPATLYSKVNELANDLDWDLTALGSYSKAGALGHGNGMFQMPKTRKGFYLSEGTTVPKMEELNLIISEGLRAFNTGFLRKGNTEEALKTLASIRDLFKRKMKDGVLKLSEGGSVSEAISSKFGDVSNIVSPLMSDLFNTDTLDVFSNLRSDDSASTNMSQIPPQRVVFEFPSGSSGEFNAPQTTINDFVKLIKRSKQRTH